MSGRTIESSSRTSTSYESSLVSKSTVLESSTLTQSRPLCSVSLSDNVDYGPFHHRNSLNHTSYSYVVYFICRSIGLGFLCMPYAFQQVGAAVGFGLCLFTGLAFDYSYTLLHRFKYEIHQIHKVPITPYYSYQNLIEGSLTLGPKIISSFSTIFKFSFIAVNQTLHFGTSCLYTKFASMTIQELLVDTGAVINSTDACLIYTVLCLAFLLFPPTKYLRTFNVLSQITCIILLGYVYGYIFTSDIKIYDNQSLINGDWTDVYQFFGILLFSFVPVTQTIKIENELIKPKNCAGPSFSLLAVSMAIVTNMYVAIGLWGYLTYQNLPKIGYSVLTVMPETRFLSFVKFCFTLHIMILHKDLYSESVSLWLSPIEAPEVMKMERDKKPSSPSALAWSMAATKIIFTFCSFLMSVTFLSPAPGGRLVLETVMALTGYLGNACNMLVYPYVVELCLTYRQHGMSGKPYVIAKDVCVVAVGLLITACGTLAVIVRIIHDD